MIILFFHGRMLDLSGGGTPFVCVFVFVCAVVKGVFKGGGFRGFKPPPKFSDFFLKSEGKEIERKRKKRDVGGGGVTS